MRDLVMKVFRLRNVFILVALSASLVGVVDGVGWIETTGGEKMILVLLGFLCIDAISERLGYLESIRSAVVELAQRVRGRGSADQLLGTRDGLRESTDRMFAKGRTFWMAGKNLDGLLKNLGPQISQRLQQGASFRFITANPNNHALLKTISAGSYGTDSQEQAQSAVLHATRMIRKIAKASTAGSIQLRYCDCGLANAFFIVNRNSEDAEMVVELYGHKISLLERRHLNLHRRSDPVTFTFYAEQFERLWCDSIPVEMESESVDGTTL